MFKKTEEDEIRISEMLPKGYLKGLKPLNIQKTIKEEEK